MNAATTKAWKRRNRDSMAIYSRAYRDKKRGAPPRKWRARGYVLSLFETPLPAPSQSESTTSSPDPNSCPKCGRKSQVSTRPLEYGGRDRYCAQCPGDEAGELLRWRSEEGIPF